MKKLAFALVTPALALIAMAAPVSATSFTSDHCGTGGTPAVTGCTGTGQPGGFATITGVDNGGGSVTVTITLLNGNGLVGGLNGLTTFTFNSTQNQAITFDFGANASLFDVSNSATNTANAGSIMQDGFGTFEYGFNY